MGGPYEGGKGPFSVSLDIFGPLSDDTQLTLATCEAIIEIGRPEPEAIAKSFLRWFRERRISGVGASTLKALRDLDAGVHWTLAGRKGEMAAGNGAAMRIAPVAFLVDPHRDDLLWCATSAESRITMTRLTQALWPSFLHYKPF